MKIDMRSAPSGSDELKKILVVMSDIAEVFKAQSVNSQIQVSVLAGLLGLIANRIVPPKDQERWLAVFLDAVRTNIRSTKNMVDEQNSEAAAFLAQLEAARRH